MVLRLFGIKEEATYGEEITATDKPDWHNRVSKNAVKLGDEPFIITSGSRMDHKVRPGVMNPTAEIESDVDLKRIGHLFKAFMDNYVFTAGTGSDGNIHEFYGGECSTLSSFKGWATFDLFEKWIRGLVMDSLKLEVSNEQMSCTHSWVYMNEKMNKITENEYEYRDVEGAIPLMFYDVSLEMAGAPVPGIATSFSFEGNNNLNVDGTIGLGSRWPQRRASAQKREIKLSLVSYLARETIDLINKAEYGELADVPSDCKIFTTDLVVRVAICEDPNDTLEIRFPKCHVAVEYESSEADEIEVTFNLQTLGSGEVTLENGDSVTTDMYVKLVNNVDEISPSTSGTKNSSSS